jgi:HK97 family phage major capsid protein
MKELLALARKLVNEGKTFDEAISLLYAENPSAKQSDVLDAIRAVKKEISTALALKKEEEEEAEQEKKAAESTALTKTIDDEVEKKLAEKLAAIQNPQDPLTQSKALVSSQSNMKSFLAGFTVVRDESWRLKMFDLVRANFKKDHETARKLSGEFLATTKLYSEEDKKQYGEKLLRGDAVTGSYAVPDEFSDMVFVIAQAAAAIVEGSTKLNLSSDIMYLLGSGDVSFTEVTDQTTELTNSEPVLSQTSMSVVDAGAYSLVHKNLIDDSNVNIVNLLAGAYGRGLAKYLKRATTVGNVSSSGDKINGIYSTSGIGSVTVADAFGSMSYDDLCALEGAIDDSFLDGAHFEMHRREFTKIRGIKDSIGRPILTSPDGNYKNYTLLGYPVKINNQMPITLNSTTGNRTTGSTATILFGNAREVQHGFKGGFLLESSEHYKFTNRQVTFRGFARWAQAVVQTSAWAALRGIK